MAWLQKEISISAKDRGCHLITEELLSKVPEIKSIKLGIAHIFIQHTSASITMNENHDSAVRDDTEMMLNRLLPETAPFKHTEEGPDDMPGHLKAMFIGSNVTVPITDGKLNTGTWQGLWLCEHRNHGGTRKFVITVQGQPKR